MTIVSSVAAVVMDLIALRCLSTEPKALNPQLPKSKPYAPETDTITDLQSVV